MFHLCFACVLLVLPILATADPIPLGFSKLAEHETLRMFDEFTSTFARKYVNPSEHQSRYAIFKDNLGVIDRLNREEQGTARYGVTRFADLTYDEFVRNFTGGKIPHEAWARHEAGIVDEQVEIEFMDDDFERDMEVDSVSSEEVEDEDDEVQIHGKVYLPKKYDYRKKKAVTPVKDQGNCGSCWAFSTMANIEGVYAKKNKKLINLAEQELLDCDTKDHACDGGWMENAVNELVRLGGAAKTADYPYTARKGTCKFTKKMAEVKVSGNKNIPANEKKIARALVKNGPLSIAVVASSNFQFYQSGIFDPSPAQCSTDKNEVNHGVTFVAYGEEAPKSDKKDKKPFWVIKNSWGSTWGDKGYMKIVRGKNACSVSSYVSTATL